MTRASRRCSWREARVSPYRCVFVCVQLGLTCVHLPSPHKGSIDLCGERVVFKRWDLAEHVGEEQVDEGDGDGRKVLEDQTDHPVVLWGTLRNTIKDVRYELFTKSRTHWKKTRCSASDSYLGLWCCRGEVDKVEGSTQQRENEQVEDEPEKVETRLLLQCPLSLAQGETLLLQEQLRTNRRNTGEPLHRDHLHITVFHHNKT